MRLTSCKSFSDLDFQMSVAFLNAAQDKRFAVSLAGRHHSVRLSSYLQSTRVHQNRSGQFGSILAQLLRHIDKAGKATFSGSASSDNFSDRRVAEPITMIR